MTRHLEATGFLILKATRRYGATNQATGQKAATAMKIDGYRAGRPEALSADQVVVRVRVEIPATAFDPVIPDITLHIPEAEAIRPLVCTVVDDSDDIIQEQP